MRRKKERKRKNGVPEIPVNSFSDIAFLLIVFFIVASTLVKTMGVVTDSSSGEASDAKIDKTPIVMIKDGKLMLDDAAVDVRGLRRKLADLKLYEKDGEKKIVMLETAGTCEYQVYYSAMTAISGAGGVVALVKERE